VVLSRRWSALLLAVALWNWLIWPRFGLAIWNDPRSWHGSVGDGTPTGFLWVHAVLIVVSVVAGTVLGVLGWRGWRAAGRRASGTRASGTRR